MEKKDKILLICLSVVLALFIPLCVFAGFRYFGKTENNNKLNEKEEQKENVNNNNEENNEEQFGQKEEEVTIQYPKLYSEAEVNKILAHISSIDDEEGYIHEDRSLNQYYKTYKEQISFENYKHNTSTSFGFMVVEEDYKVLTIKNGELFFTETKNKYNITGIEGTAVAVEGSCWFEYCDVFVLTEEGKLYYMYYPFRSVRNKYQKDWHFEEIKVGEKVNKIKKVIFAGWNTFGDQMIKDKMQVETIGKPSILYETKGGIYRIITNDKEGVSISEKVVSEEYKFIKGILVDYNIPAFLTIDSNKNVNISVHDDNEIKSKSLLTDDNQKIKVKRYFIIRGEVDANFDTKNIIYLISEDNYLYYYIGGNKLKKYSNSKIESIVFSERYVSIGFKDGKEFKHYITESLED